MAGKNTGAPINKDLMKKLVGKSHGMDTSHIKVKSDTGRETTGFKPTPEEVEKWQRGESIDSNGEKTSSPVIDIHTSTKNTLRTLLEKQIGPTPPQRVTASCPPTFTAGPSGGRGEDMFFKYDVNAPVPNLDESFSRAVQKVKGKTVDPRLPAREDLPYSVVRTTSTAIPINEEEVTEALPVDRLKGMLEGLGDALTEAAGGRFGLTVHFPFQGTSCEFRFQHRINEGDTESGLEINVLLNQAASVSIATVSTPLNGEEAVMQSVSRGYLSPNALIEDLSSLIDAAGAHVGNE